MATDTSFRRSVAAIGVASFLAVSAGSAPASASQGRHNTFKSPSVFHQKMLRDSTEQREFLVSNGVAPKVADRLVKRLQAGERLESDGGHKPKRVKVTKSSSTIKTVNYFKDGSVSVYQTPNFASFRTLSGKALVHAASVSSCSVSSTHYSATYTGCVTSAKNSHVLLAYRFNYKAASGTAPTLTRYYAPDHTAWGGAFSGGSFEKINSQVVRYAGTWTMYGGGFSTGCYLQVQLSGSTTASDSLQC